MSDLVATGSRPIANGQLAKTDRVGAAMLAKMGALLELKADLPKSEALHDLKQLATARLALLKDRTAAKARLAATTHNCLPCKSNAVWHRSNVTFARLQMKSMPSLRPAKISLHAPKSSRAFRASPRSQPVQF